MDWIVSVGWTERLNDCGGFRDLNVRFIEPDPAAYMRY